MNPLPKLPRHMATVPDWLGFGLVFAQGDTCLSRRANRGFVA
jgi:hypothetical protein